MKYCPRCDQMTDDPNHNCSFMMIEVDQLHDMLETGKAEFVGTFKQEVNRYYNSVWNEAIEAAAKIADDNDEYTATHIRKLKK